LLLPGSRLVDPARGRVAGPPDTSTPAPIGSAPALPPSCSPARDSRALQCNAMQAVPLLNAARTGSPASHPTYDL
uniref:Uncharacterized protein n=1 Tax=Aegilops tauschii subsp. strangulata TaxID=200361 RepID=A0A453BMB7_AEGTS